MSVAFYYNYENTAAQPSTPFSYSFFFLLEFLFYLCITSPYHLPEPVQILKEGFRILFYSEYIIPWSLCSPAEVWTLIIPWAFSIAPDTPFKFTQWELFCPECRVFLFISWNVFLSKLHMKDKLWSLTILTVQNLFCSSRFNIMEFCCENNLSSELGLYSFH